MLIAFVPVAVGCSPAGDATPADTAVDSLAILDALQALESRAAAGDIGFFEIYDEEAVVMFPGRWSDADRSTAERFYAQLLERAPETFRDNSREIHEITVSGDWAFLRATFRRPPRESRNRELVRGGSRHLMIWRRQPDGEWKLYRDIFNNPAPAR